MFLIITKDNNQVTKPMSSEEVEREEMREETHDLEDADQEGQDDEDEGNTE